MGRIFERQHSIILQSKALADTRVSVYCLSSAEYDVIYHLATVLFSLETHAAVRATPGAKS